jgi:LCP family protein required for cell wall assembly
MNDPKGPPGPSGKQPARPAAQPPEYKVYRSRRSPLSGMRPKGGLGSLRPGRGRRSERQPRDRRPLTPGRIVAWIALAIGAWLLLSLIVFLISAQVEPGVSDAAKKALSSQGNLLSGANILILGSDARTGQSIDKSQQGPSRADSIMLVHAAFGSVHKLSIPRDSYAQIPGHDGQKINAAYALGGAALMVNTVENFLGNGVKINHVVEVDFKDFPKLIDSLGGVTVDNKTRICSPGFDNYYNGFKLSKGKHRLSGKQALGYSRVRKNPCAPGENDIDRARRQQEVFAAIPKALFRPSTFPRYPIAAWRAPKALKTDMKGPSLLALFADMASGGSSDTAVLEPSCLGCGPGSSLLVSPGAKADAVRKLGG